MTRDASTGLETEKEGKEEGVRKRSKEKGTFKEYYPKEKGTFKEYYPAFLKKEKGKPEFEPAAAGMSFSMTPEA